MFRLKYFTMFSIINGCVFRCPAAAYSTTLWLFYQYWETIVNTDIMHDTSITHKYNLIGALGLVYINKVHASYDSVGFLCVCVWNGSNHAVDWCLYADHRRNLNETRAIA